MGGAPVPLASPLPTFMQHTMKFEIENFTFDKTQTTFITKLLQITTTCNCKLIPEHKIWNTCDCTKICERSVVSTHTLLTVWRIPLRNLDVLLPQSVSKDIIHRVRWVNQITHISISYSELKILYMSWQLIYNFYKSQ